MVHRLILFLSLLAVSSGVVLAQDIHFSQYYASPLSLNPANTGNFDGDWRVTNNYRNQWRALSIPFRTISAGFDKQLWIYSEKFSWGAYVINDKSGPAGLTVNKIFLSFAWHKTRNNNNYHIGLQGGLVTKNFAIKDLTFPNQFDMTTGYFNNQISNNEDNFRLNTTYPDLNFGIGWNKKMRFFTPDIGVSLFHIISPKEAFFDSKNNLPLRTAVNAGLNVPIGIFFIRPMAFYMMQTDKATEMLGGGEIGFNFAKAKIIRQVFAGYLFRNDFSTAFDASILIFGLQFKQLQLGFSYDINTSPLKVVTNKKGAFEVSLIYISKSTIPQKITIPCNIM